MAAQHLRVITSTDWLKIKNLPDNGQACVVLGLSGVLGYIAIKIYYNDIDLVDEIQFLTENAHKYIVRVLGQHGIPRQVGFFINGLVMEFMPGGSVHEAIYKEGVSPCSRKPYLWIKQAAEALVFLHSRRVCHGDIKPSNMLLSTDWSILKLGDFASAQLLPDRIDETFVLSSRTIKYVAPELYEDELSENPADILSGDNYALGITLWEIIHKRIPFSDDFDRAKNIFKGERPTIDTSLMTDQMIRQLCMSLWHQDPGSRCNLAEVVKICDQKLTQFENTLHRWTKIDSAGKQIESLDQTILESLDNLSLYDKGETPKTVALTDGTSICHLQLIRSTPTSQLYSGDLSSERVYVKQRTSSEEKKEEDLKKLLNLPPHSHIIKLIDAIYFPNPIGSLRFAFVMEFATDGDLSQLLRPGELEYSNEQGNLWIYKISDGLVFLHKHKIVHGNLKPKNILFFGENKRHLKLTDFGELKHLKNSAISLWKEAYCYMSPEVLCSGITEGDLDNPFPVDMYSLAIIWWEILHKKPPFKFRSVQMLYTALTEGLRPQFENNNDKIQDIIKRCWDISPEARKSASQICEFAKQLMKSGARKEKEGVTEKYVGLESTTSTEGLINHIKTLTPILHEELKKPGIAMESTDFRDLLLVPRRAVVDILIKQKEWAVLKEFISVESQKVQQAFEVFMKSVDKVDLLRKNDSRKRFKSDDQALIRSPQLPSEETLANQLQNTTVREYNYQDIADSAKLGEGSQATAFLCTFKRNHTPLVFKEFFRWNDEVETEIRNLIETITGPNIVRLFGILVKNRRRIGIVMEYCEDGSLDKIVYNPKDYYTAVSILEWMLQATNGIQFLHERGIIHRDVKPANMLLSHNRKHLKLSDMSPSIWTGGNQYENTFNGRGTLGFRAWEIEDDEDYTFPVDIFSIGRSLWNLLHRQHPTDRGLAVSFCNFLPFRDLTERKRMSPCIKECFRRACKNSRDRTLEYLYTQYLQSPKEYYVLLKETLSKDNVNDCRFLGYSGRLRTHFLRIIAKMTAPIREGRLNITDAYNELFILFQLSKK